MTEPNDATATVRAETNDALAGHRLLLAVSGGVDSMVLLDAATAVARESIVAVATFDHGTGDFARRAVAHVAREARVRGLSFVSGRADLGGATEAEWRDARWAFLRQRARDLGADGIATAHTRDDQIETVAMRVLRDASARGLAGLYAPRAGVVRPLLAVSRGDVERYARVQAVRWLEDPSNRSMRHRRNRVRHELLPALAPGVADGLLDIARQAAEWRHDVERFVDEHIAPQRVCEGDGGGVLHVATSVLVRYDAEALAVLWPAIAARVGVRLDRRGTVRLTDFTTRVAAGDSTGATMPLSGGIEATVGRGEIILRPRRSPRAIVGSAHMEGEERPLADGVEVGAWRLRRGATRRPDAEGGGALRAWLPADRPLTVRAWRAGDRMQATEGRAARRVKRFFADARVPGADRPGWPVVLAGGEIVWIPGVRRSDAATDRPGRPGVHYLCERIDG